MLNGIATATNKRQTKAPEPHACLMAASLSKLKYKVLIHSKQAKHGYLLANIDRAFIQRVLSNLWFEMSVETQMIILKL